MFCDDFKEFRMQKYKINRKGGVLVPPFPLERYYFEYFLFFLILIVQNSHLPQSFLLAHLYQHTRHQLYWRNAGYSKPALRVLLSHRCVNIRYTRPGSFLARSKPFGAQPVTSGIQSTFVRMQS